MRIDLNIYELENLCIEIRKPSDSEPFIVVNWYRLPNSPTGLFSHLENLIARLDLTNLEFFLLGRHMNADMASTNYDNNVRQLTNIAGIYGLHQLISKECVTKLILKLKLLNNYFTITSLSKPIATRVKHGKSSTILHLVRPSIHRSEK